MKITLTTIFLIGFVSIVGRATEDPISLTTLKGDAVSVSPDEIRKGYVKLVERLSNNAEEIISNEDGSVAIVVPKFQYAGRNLRIEGDNNSSRRGTCRRFGFKSELGAENETIESENNSVVQLNDDGKLEEILPPTPLVRRSIIKTIGCR